MLTTQFINEMQASEEFIRDMEAYNKEFPINIEAMLQDLDKELVLNECSSGKNPLVSLLQPTA